MAANPLLAFYCLSMTHGDHVFCNRNVKNEKKGEIGSLLLRENLFVKRTA
jgi:hypothetical protein